MIKGNSGNRFSTEVRARAVRLVLENEADRGGRGISNAPEDSRALPRILPPQTPFETYKVVEGFW